MGWPWCVFRRSFEIRFGEGALAGIAFREPRSAEIRLGEPFSTLIAIRELRFAGIAFREPHGARQTKSRRIGPRETDSWSKKAREVVSRRIPARESDSRQNHTPRKRFPADTRPAKHD